MPVSKTKKSGRKAERRPARSGRARGASDRRRRYAAGEASRDRILEAAARVLARDGYHALSTRRVADECGISVGNLTYYFPTKDDLIETLMEAFHERYEQRYSGPPSAEGSDPHDWLGERVTEMLADAADGEASGLFLEFLVMARHNDFAAEVLNRLYERGTHAIADALAHQFPGRSRQEMLRVAYLVAVLLDGMGTVFSRPGDRAVERDDVVPLAVEALKALVERGADPA